jgi:NADH dehydrogenase/NADH:ubiquinone oxidoreductase subunit G
MYHTRKKLGVEFHGRQIEKNRIIAYAKHLDLLKPENKKFIATLSNPSKMLKDAQSIIRIETNHTTFRSIRNRLKVKENTLKQVLESTQPVNYDFLVKVLMGRSGQQMQIFDELKAFDGSFDEFIMLKGIETIIQSFDANDEMVKHFFKCGFQHNFNYHYYKKKNSIKQLLAKAKANKHQTTMESSNAISSKVLSALKQLAA